MRVLVRVTLTFLITIPVLLALVVFGLLEALRGSAPQRENGWAGSGNLSPKYRASVALSDSHDFHYRGAVISGSRSHSLGTIKNG